METDRELSLISEEPSRSFDRSGCISIVPSPISTNNPNPSFDESSPGFELSLSSTEPNPSFDDSSAPSMDPSPSTSKRTPSLIPMSLVSTELKAISDTSVISVKPTTNSVEKNLGSTERTASFKHCLSVSSTATCSRKSNQAISQAPNSLSLAIVPPPSLSRLLTVLPSPSKSKIPVNLTSRKHRSGCDSTNFSSCTVRSILKCGPRFNTWLNGQDLHRRVEPDVSMDSPNSKIIMNYFAFKMD